MTIPPLGLQRLSEYPPNPRAPEALTDMLGWAALHRVSEVFGDDDDMVTYLSGISVDLASFVGPGLDRAGLDRTAEQCGVLFYVDSFADDEARGQGGERPEEFYKLLNTADHILADPEVYVDLANPLTGILSDLALHTREGSSPAQYERWADSIQGYLGGVELELYYRDFGQTPGIEEFIAMREETSGVRVVLRMMEIAEGFAVPQEAWDDPAMQTAMRNAVQLIAALNDLKSYAREVASERAELNWLTILQHAGRNSQEAIDELVVLCNTKQAELLEQERQFQEAGAAAPLLRWFEGVRYWINGYLNFSDQHSR